MSKNVRNVDINSYFHDHDCKNTHHIWKMFIFLDQNKRKEKETDPTSHDDDDDDDGIMPNLGLKLKKNGNQIEEYRHFFSLLQGIIIHSSLKCWIVHHGCFPSSFFIKFIILIFLINMIMIFGSIPFWNEKKEE